jgi:nucleotide-binding universal stress UspA family protein
MKSIVVAYDGSEPAKRALERAAELADGAAVTVVSAVHVLPSMGRTMGPVDKDEIEERREELKEAASYLESKGIKPQTVELRAGDVGEALVEHAKEGGADLIVVGSGGKGAAERIFVGSVSSKVVHEAECDVLVVR